MKEGVRKQGKNNQFWPTMKHESYDVEIMSCDNLSSFCINYYIAVYRGKTRSRNLAHNYFLHPCTIYTGLSKINGAKSRELSSNFT